MSDKRFSIEELIEHCERQKKRMGGMCMNSSNILLLEHMDTAEYLKELKEYKAAEEQGLLVRLPCNVGDTLYQVIADINEYTVIAVGIYENRMIICADNKETGIGFSFDANRIGKRYFLTKEEAEASLAEMAV